MCFSEACFEISLIDIFMAKPKPPVYFPLCVLKEAYIIHVGVESLRIYQNMPEATLRQFIVC